ncbi:OBERON-like protein [Phragmites australis]|uniref:OBERON-like protein n=1 Tax=Phragmites australis TaxID=29695 RepID=UPI002D78A827|nr:OBERON-like protein [Phragmites australis]XP_062202136.1 OBERON-like protein [Phragmites australis]
MGTSSGANFHQQPPSQGMLPPRHGPRPTGLQTSLSLASSEQVGSLDTQEPGSNSDPGHDSATESASSRDTWPVEPNQSNGGAAAGAVNKADKEKEVSNGVSKLQVVCGASRVGGRLLREVARERVDLVAEKMKVLPEEHLEGIKNELRSILEGSGGSHHIEEFMYLQKLVQDRADLTPSMLSMAHHVQLEILVAIKTGIQAFLHPSVTIPQSRLVEVFLYKRCRNIACQSALPAEECRCNVCANRNGFCNLCMCVICNKFDFEVNTCRWIGCDFCSHWTHTDCAIHNGQIGMGQSVKSSTGHAEMLFRCRACQRTSELLGWVKDVFQQCAPGWDRDALLRELEFVCKIFRLSEDPKGRVLFRKCAELIERLRNTPADSINPRMILQALQELEMDSPKNSENDDSGRLITPQEACNRIAEVVQEAVRKMELVAEEKMRLYKKDRLAVEACDRELEEKVREAQELKAEQLRKKQQVEELESIVRLKQAEAEMFQLKASEARQEAERLQSIALAKSERAEQDYASMYLKRRLEEAEAEKQFLFEKIKLQENRMPSLASSSRAGVDPAQTLMLSKIQDLLKNVRSMPTKSEGH